MQQGAQPVGHAPCCALSSVNGWCRSGWRPTLTLPPNLSHGAILCQL